MATATEGEIFTKLRSILAEILILPEDEIHLDSRLVDDLDADSIAFLELTWHLRQDFGVDVPEVKVDEETLTKPMLEGLEIISAKSGGVTLFEFMQQAAVDTDDSAVAQRATEVFRSTMARPEFGTWLRQALSPGATDTLERDVAASLLAAVYGRSDLKPTLDALLRQSPELRKTLAAIGKASRGDLSSDPERAIGLWRRLLSWNRPKWALELTAGDLAVLLGSSVPPGIDRSTRLSALVLRDLFRFITVDTYVQYIEALRRPGG